VTRAVVFANGDCSDRVCSLVGVSNTDYIVCVDGGARHCLAAGLSPDLLVGDSDSLDASSASTIDKLNIEQVRFSINKDASDLDLTLRTLCDRAIKEVVLLGVSGGRTDHLLFNWQLAGSRSWPFQLRIIDDFVDAMLVDSLRPLSISVPIGQLFSVIPVAQSAAGVVVSGALYPLKNAELMLGSTLGLSNEATESRLQVSVEKGIVLVVLVHTLR